MGRKRGSRFRRGSDEQKQLEEIEKAQQAARKKKIRKLLDSIKKSEQRFQNRLNKVRRPADAREEFEP